MPPTYPIFSKKAQRAERVQRNNRGAYNFARTRECDEAENWFAARKETRKEYNPPPKPEPCDLDLRLPSYAEFAYDERSIIQPPIRFYDTATIQHIFAIWARK